MKSYRVIGVIFGIMLAISVFSCSSTPSDCTGEIAAGGKTYTASGKGQEKATRNACNKYCLDTDAECEAMYGIWVNSPKGKAAGSPAKMRALSEDKQLLDCVTIKCANACLEQIKAGTIQFQASCQ